MSSIQAFGKNLVMSEFGSLDPNGAQTWQACGEATADHPAWADGFANAYDGGGKPPCYVIGWKGWKIPAGWQRVSHGIAKGDHRIEYYGDGKFTLIRVEGTSEHPRHHHLSQNVSVVALAAMV